MFSKHQIYSFSDGRRDVPLEILEKHPKGIEYANLLEGMDKFPVIFDSDNKVLSFPPIINGSHTTVSNTTKISY